MGGRRGRRTVEDVLWQSNVPIIPGEAIKPLAAPSDLCEREKRLWRSITARLIPSYFQAEHRPLLAAYVRHSEIADAIAARINELRKLPMDEAAWKTFSKLSRDLGVHSSAICQLATKMRLCQSARLTQQLASVDAQAQSSDLPVWSDWGDRAKKRDDEPKSN
jgi:hypothetical protein